MKEEIDIHTHTPTHTHIHTCIHTHAYIYTYAYTCTGPYLSQQTMKEEMRQVRRSGKERRAADER